MKHKTSELNDGLLDAAVVLAGGWTLTRNPFAAFENPKDGTAAPFLLAREHGRWRVVHGSGAGSWYGAPWRPSTDWKLGGWILQSKQVARIPQTAADGTVIWHAQVWKDRPDWVGICEGEFAAQGPDELTAGLRAFVLSELGPEVDLPDDATQENRDA